MTIFAEGRKMNWYQFVKLSQIWNPSYDYDGEINDFRDALATIYELEYKWSMAKTRLFNGHPKRNSNIIRHMEQKLWQAVLLVQQYILPTFEQWLGEHTILNPQEWAIARTRDAEDDDENGNCGLSHALYEYVRYKYGPFGLPITGNYESRIMSEVLSSAAKNMAAYPAMSQFVETFKDNLRLDYENEFEAEQDPQTKQELQEQLQNVENLGLYDVIDYAGDNDPDSFANLVRSNYGDMCPIVQEILANNVFPLWFQYWKKQTNEQGNNIVATRKNIEKVTEQLRYVPAMDLSRAIMTINVALNTIHQGGSMIGYLEDDTGESGLQKLLDDLSSGKNVPKWNKQLKEVGYDLSQPVVKFE